MITYAELFQLLMMLFAFGAMLIDLINLLVTIMKMMHDHKKDKKK